MPVTAPSRDAVHQQRQIAESFGADATRYDRARPTYPAALVDRILDAAHGRDILDVGCGTGIATRLFTAAGCRVLGIDPDPRMAQITRDAGSEVQVGRFEDWDARGRRFDAVISGQAWHWVEPAAGAAKAASLLRRGGRLAVFWNVFNPPAQLRLAFDGVYRRVLARSPLRRFWTVPASDVSRMMTGTAADGIISSSLFDAPELWHLDWARPVSRQDWLDLVPTLGGHGDFGPDVLDELLTGLGAAVDSAGGAFMMRYTTVAVVARVADSAGEDG
jgi:SAM-dependent methyltransferase